MPFTGRCIAYNYDGSNFEADDHSRLLYENGEAISDVRKYFLL
jgi:hypothetical protein